MGGRPVDEERRQELLDAVVDHTIEHGFAELSWRRTASAVGVAPTSLVHRFGTKEQMLQAVQERLRERIMADTGAAIGLRAGLAAAARAVWERTSRPERGAEFRLFFAVYGRALQAPGEFADFLDHVVADWMGTLIAAQPAALDESVAARRATLVIASLRGLLADLLTTGDSERVHDAAEHYLASLEE